MEACFCEHCRASGVCPINEPFCIKCGAPFQNTISENHVCGACLKNPSALGRVRAALAYEGIVKDAIPLFKYQSKLSLARVFEHVLFQSFVRYYSSAGIDLILPVPLHRKKLKKRGFNQAFLLVRNFSKRYQKAYQILPEWQIDTGSLVRIKPTEPQTGFDVEQRKHNLKKAFTVVDKKAIENKHILLVDDVYTTGATCNEAAGELLRNNARTVDALVLARA
jgi:ComF family protein